MTVDGAPGREVEQIVQAAYWLRSEAVHTGRLPETYRGRTPAAWLGDASPLVAQAITHYLLKDPNPEGNAAQDGDSAALYPSVAASDWWGAVAPKMVESFNALTALRLGSYKECWAWWKKNHRRVKARKA